MQSLNEILTVVIGLVFVYLILSMLVSYIIEMISTMLQMRQQVLANALQILLDPTTSRLAVVNEIEGVVNQAIQVGGFWYRQLKLPPPPQSAWGVTVLLTALLRKVFTKSQKELYMPTPELLTNFYAHPAISSLSLPGKLPSYVNGETFATVLLDLLHHYGNQMPAEIKALLPEDLRELTIEELRDKLPADLLDVSLTQLRAMEPDELPKEIENLSPEAIYKIISENYLTRLENGLKFLEKTNPALATVLHPYFETAHDMQGQTEAKLAAISKKITDWYGNTMDRTSGWYKRETQKIALTISFLIVLLLNADTVDIFLTLWQNASLRETVNSMAVEFVRARPELSASVISEDNIPGGLNEIMAQVRALNSALPLPLGWSGFIARVNLEISSPNANLFGTIAGLLLLKLFGLFATTLAISQGSSIWYQLLSKLINLRNTGVKPEEKAEAK